MNASMTVDGAVSVVIYFVKHLATVWAHATEQAIGGVIIVGAGLIVAGILLFHFISRFLSWQGRQAGKPANPEEENR